ncbi:MAG TPA: MlaD family protein [Verrucomicrobiae bacterium]|nr:MlaD family protein [Verrucomicrobiae bacterium]
MPLQDLTPQLRTRLNRMERAVGWFIIFAAALLLFGFGYYIYNTAERRGWFKVKAPFYTYAQSGQGFNVGDPVKLMGFPAGQITDIIPMPPTWGQYSTNNVYIEFEVLEPNFGYIWTKGSMARLTQSGFLEKRELDLSKGTGGYATYITQTFRDNLTMTQAAALPNLETNRWKLGEEIYDGANLEVKAWQSLSPALLEKIASLVGTNTIRAIDSATKEKSLTAVWNDSGHFYERFTKKTKPYHLPPDETPALTDRLQAMVGQIQAALPNFLQLTNQLSGVLSNSTRLTENLNVVAENARPMFTNLNVITTRLRDPKGSLGEWLIPTNLNQQLGTTLENADGTLAMANTNLVTLNRTLENLANITSNLNNQVQANPNILTGISSLVVHSDQFVQGLKRFWLFRHLFRTSKTHAPKTDPPPRHVEPLLTPREKTARE